MGLYQSAKAIVPIQLRIGFRDRKSLPNDLSARVVNRLKGNAAIPPADLIYLVGNHRSAKLFLEGGRSATEAIRRILNKNRLDMEQFEKVLDFGCGVGRIIRHWNKTQGPAWHGTDYNADLIEWCKRHLKFAEFRVNHFPGNAVRGSDFRFYLYFFGLYSL